MASTQAALADGWGSSSRMDRALKLMANLAGTFATYGSSPNASCASSRESSTHGGGSAFAGTAVSREGSVHGGGGAFAGAAVSREGSVRGGISREGSFCAFDSGAGSSSPPLKFVRRHSGGQTSKFDPASQGERPLPVATAGTTSDALKSMAVKSTTARKSR